MLVALSSSSEGLKKNITFKVREQTFLAIPVFGPLPPDLQGQSRPWPYQKSAIAPAHIGHPELFIDPMQLNFLFF